MYLNEFINILKTACQQPKFQSIIVKTFLWSILLETFQQEKHQIDETVEASRF